MSDGGNSTRNIQTKTSILNIATHIFGCRSLCVCNSVNSLCVSLHTHNRKGLDVYWFWSGYIYINICLYICFFFSVCLSHGIRDLSSSKCECMCVYIYIYKYMRTVACTCVFSFYEQQADNLKLWVYIFRCQSLCVCVSLHTHNKKGIDFYWLWSVCAYI